MSYGFRREGTEFKWETNHIVGSIVHLLEKQHGVWYYKCQVKIVKLFIETYLNSNFYKVTYLCDDGNSYVEGYNADGTKLPALLHATAVDAEVARRSKNRVSFAPKANDFNFRIVEE